MICRGCRDETFSSRHLIAATFYCSAECQKSDLLHQQVHYNQNHTSQNSKSVNFEALELLASTSEANEAFMAVQAREKLYEVGKALQNVYKGYCEDMVKGMLALRVLNANHMILYSYNSALHTTNAIRLLQWLQMNGDVDVQRVYLACLIGSHHSGIVGQAIVGQAINLHLQGKQAKNASPTLTTQAIYTSTPQPSIQLTYELRSHLSDHYTEIWEATVLFKPLHRRLFVRQEHEATRHHHTILLITLKSGELYVLDLGGIQFGFTKPVVPWAKYEERVSQILWMDRFAVDL